MKKWLVFWAAGMMTAPMFSQPATPAAEIPQGPLLTERAADFSAWTSTYVYTSGPEPAAEQQYNSAMKEMADQDPMLARIMAKRPNFGARKPRVTQVNAVKTGAVKKEITLYTSGISSERWVKGRTVVMKDPFSQRIPVDSVQSEGPEGDFPEFEWVSAKNYKGLKHVLGKECLVFQDTILPIRVEDPRSYAEMEGVDGEPVPVMALIDAKTRLPVYLEYMGIQRTYAFGSPPTETLLLPADLAGELQKFEKRSQARNSAMSPP